MKGCRDAAVEAAAVKVHTRVFTAEATSLVYATALRKKALSDH